MCCNFFIQANKNKKIMSTAGKRKVQAVKDKHNDADDMQHKGKEKKSKKIQPHNLMIVFWIIVFCYFNFVNYILFCALKF